MDGWIDTDAMEAAFLFFISFRSLIYHPVGVFFLSFLLAAAGEDGGV